MPGGRANEGRRGTGGVVGCGTWGKQGHVWQAGACVTALAAVRQLTSTSTVSVPLRHRIRSHAFGHLMVMC